MRMATEIGIPLWPRLVAAAVLLLVVRRPWARVLAAILATPALYWASGVLLFALLPALDQKGKPSIVQVSHASAASATAGEWLSVSRQ